MASFKCASCGQVHDGCLSSQYRSQARFNRFT
jgi:hypothetical protein